MDKLTANELLKLTREGLAKTNNPPKRQWLFRAQAVLMDCGSEMTDDALDYLERTLGSPPNITIDRSGIYKCHLHNTVSSQESCPKD